MKPDADPHVRPDRPPESRARDKSSLELCFIAVTGILVSCAFVAALTYDTASAIAPLCIMIPLLILIAVQVRRTLRVRQSGALLPDLRRAASGENAAFNASAVFIGWMFVLLAMIFVAGHYAGIAVFMFVMLRLVSREQLVLAAAVSVGVTLLIYLLFEYGFEIEMYRGLIARWL